MVSCIILFFLIYNVPFNFLYNIGSSKFLLVYGTIEFFKRKFIIYNFFKKDCIILLIILLISIFYTMLSGERDFSFSQRILILLIEHYILNYFLVYFLIKKFNLNVRKFKILIIYIIGIQSLIMLLMLLVSDFREFIYSILSETHSLNFKEIYLRYFGIRGFGLTYNSVWDFSLFQSFGLMFICSTYSEVSRKNKLIFQLLYLLTIISICLSGRTGIIGIVFSIIMILLNFKRLYIFLFYFFNIIYIFLYLALVKKMKNILKIYNYVFEMFDNYFRTNELKTESTDILINKMFLKLSFKEKMLGYGRYFEKDGSYFMRTDAGYIRHSLYFGIFSYFLYIFYLKIFFEIFKVEKDKILIIFIVLSIFIAQLKGDLLLDSYLIEHFIFTFYFIEKINSKVKID